MAGLNFSAMRVIAVACVGAIMAMDAVTAQAQENFPNRPVRLVNPFTPGGSVDLVGRAVAHGLSDIWGHQVIVDNRPGAGTQIGTEIVVRADPDGYTMLVNSSAIAITPSMYKSMRFDSIRDVTPVSLLAKTAQFLVVNPALPAKTAKDVVALAKARPGKLASATSGVGSTTHLTMELFKSMAGVDILTVPYKGGAPAIADLIGGQVQLFFNTPGTLLSHINAGKLRAVGISSDKRGDFAPDVPTVAESGVPGFEAYIWYAIYGPRGLPAPIVNRWSDAVSQYLRSPQATDHFRKTYMVAGSGTPATFAAYHKSETERWAKVVKGAGIKPQ